MTLVWAVFNVSPKIKMATYAKWPKFWFPVKLSIQVRLYENFALTWLRSWAIHCSAFRNLQVARGLPVDCATQHNAIYIFSNSSLTNSQIVPIFCTYMLYYLGLIIIENSSCFAKTKWLWPLNNQNLTWFWQLSANRWLNCITILHIHA